MRIFVILLLILLCNQVYAASGSYTPSVGGGGSSISLPVSVANGGTGASALGPGLTNSGAILNTTQPADRSVIITTDTITAADAGRIVKYCNASAIAVSSASASSTGMTQGFTVTLNNGGVPGCSSVGAVTWTPTGSTVNGNSSFVLPANTGCQAHSDGTNFQVDYAACTALVPGSTTQVFYNNGGTFATTSLLTIGSTTLTTANGFILSATGRAYNTGTTSDTIAAGIASTYESANTASSAFTATLAAPQGDGERRRVCFKNTTGTITWAVTTPATATAGLPTTVTGGQCVEMVYNSVAGTPTNSPATSWVLY